MSANVTVHQLSEKNAYLNVIDEPYIGVGVWGYVLPLNSSRAEGLTFLFQNGIGHFALMQFTDQAAFDGWYNSDPRTGPLAEVSA